MYDYDQPRYFPITLPSFKSQPVPSESMMRPVLKFKAHSPLLPSCNSPLLPNCNSPLSNKLPFLSYRLDYGGVNSDCNSSSASSNNGEWADYTYPSSRAINVWEISPSDVKVDVSSPGHNTESNNPHTKLPSVGKLFISKTTATRETFLPVAKRARTTSCSSDDSTIHDDQHLAAVNSVQVIARSPGQTPPTLPPVAWPSAPPTLTSATRTSPSGAFTRQDWQNYATREANGSWRCIWTEDELTCTYKSKKQATKRHIELKHMKMKYILLT
ncbi:hypothetical protein H2248_010892 [Termitomyces sp. 'cryptogamus']|nr:hypothetical protein H2248_010892 [Termitomyces sp. 'cryptogamus']